jgi:hypothetical protein
VGCGGALPTQEFTEEAGPAPRVVDVWEQAESVIGVLTSGAVAGDPALPSGEDRALVVVERRAARRLVVGDEAVELVEGGQRVGLVESPVDGVDDRRAADQGTATSARYRPTWPSAGTASGSAAAPASQIG